MPRLARVVVPDYPHHVTQRGSRKQRTFYRRSDYRAYLRMIAERKSDVGVVIWAYCLMPNHVHFVATPATEYGFARLFHNVHRRYARRINVREGWRGHLWQERFFSVPMDEEHLLAAVRYVELNPVRARLCEDPADWPWSSVHAHQRSEDDQIVTVAPMMQRVSDWDAYLSTIDSAETTESIRKHTCTGRPLGDDSFVDRMELLTGRRLKKRRPGPAPRVK
ncbi:MAG: transposase [Proteobacteria bacterium]|nr:transposase [Pseudomonadota bacterium]